MPSPVKSYRNVAFCVVAALVAVAHRWLQKHPQACNVSFASAGANEARGGSGRELEAGILELKALLILDKRKVAPFTEL
jgi:hypothetical protein